MSQLGRNVRDRALTVWRVGPAHRDEAGMTGAQIFQKQPQILPLRVRMTVPLARDGGMQKSDLGGFEP